MSINYKSNGTTKTLITTSDLVWEFAEVTSPYSNEKVIFKKCEALKLGLVRVNSTLKQATTKGTVITFCDIPAGYYPSMYISVRETNNRGYFMIDSSTKKLNHRDGDSNWGTGVNFGCFILYPLA